MVHTSEAYYVKKSGQSKKKGRCTSCLLHMKRLPPAALLQQWTPAVWTRHALTSAGRQATVNHRGVTFSIARSLQILQCIMLQHLYAHSWGDRINLTQKLFVLGWLTRCCRSVRVQSKATLRLNKYSELVLSVCIWLLNIYTLFEQHI